MAVDADRSYFALKYPNGISANSERDSWLRFCGTISWRLASPVQLAIEVFHRRTTQATWHLRFLMILPSTEADTIFQGPIAMECLSTRFGIMLRLELRVNSPA